MTEGRCNLLCVKFVCFVFIVLGFDRIPLYGVLILSIGGGILAGVIVLFFVSSYLKKKILREVYGDERERTFSGASAVSFSKSPRIIEPEVCADGQESTGKFQPLRPSSSPQFCFSNMCII